MLNKDPIQLDEDRARLLHWFEKNQREVPWRKNRDPYRVWIAEVMLQQTTTTAVIPYYEKFLEHFPDLKSLAAAPLKQVLSLWAGLGYYSRAKNLKLAAEKLAEIDEFPRRSDVLLTLPGFGPYTARAVSSQAFGESVGVVDGNVIRVFSRYFNWRGKWWTTTGRKEIQDFMNLWVQNVSSNLLNQAVMELGSTICTAISPSCALCPLAKNCNALKLRTQLKLPLKRAKRAREIWIWKVDLLRRNDKIALAKTPHIPFLKNHLALPGLAHRATQVPKKYSFKHTITHHDIYVIINKKIKLVENHLKWVRASQISHHTPLSLVRKVIQHAN